MSSGVGLAQHVGRHSGSPVLSRADTVLAGSVAATAVLVEDLKPVGVGRHAEISLQKRQLAQFQVLIPSWNCRDITMKISALEFFSEVSSSVLQGSVRANKHPVVSLETLRQAGSCCQLCSAVATAMQRVVPEDPRIPPMALALPRQCQRNCYVRLL